MWNRWSHINFLQWVAQEFLIGFELSFIRLSKFNLFLKVWMAAFDKLYVVGEQKKLASYSHCTIPNHMNKQQLSNSSHQERNTFRRKDLSYMYACIHVYMYTCIHFYMYICIHVYIFTFIQLRKKILLMPARLLASKHALYTFLKCDSPSI